MTRKKQVIAGFDRGAKTYSRAASLQDQVADNLSRYFSRLSATKILEIGCGTGLLTQRLTKAFPRADFLLTDISPAMIAECRAHMTNLTESNFLCVDAEKPSELPSTFDLIVSSMTMHWFDEFEIGLNNIKQKLKKNGKLLFAILTNNSFHEWQKICNILNYPIATPHFPDINKLKNQFPDFIWHVEEIKKTYPNAYTFLKSLKSLGAVATRPGYKKLSNNEMLKLLDHADHEIEITYEVVYGEYSAV